MGPFLEKLKDDHKIIQNVLATMYEVSEKIEKGQKPNLELTANIIEFCDFYITKYHHAIEEEVLFPHLHASGAASKGGPMCGLFMQYFLDRNPTQGLMKPIKEGQVPSPELGETARSLFAANSPLTIPLEEHIAGHLCMDLIKKNFKVYQDNGSCLSDMGFYLEKYVELLSLHIRKENECLFMMADRASPPEVQEDMLQKLRQIEKSLGPGRIREMVEFSLSLKKAEPKVS